MPSPIGHSLGAYIATGGGFPDTSMRAGNARQLLIGFALLIFAGNAPDLDFFWGAWMGDMNAYHHGPSHSIAAVFTFFALAWLLLHVFRQPRGLAITAGLAYLSHLLLDLFTADRTLPYGMQLFWPFDDQYVLASKAYFMNIEHGDMGSTVLDALPAIFSAHNLTAIGFELLVLGPPALILFLLRRNRSGEQESGSSMRNA